MTERVLVKRLFSNGKSTVGALYIDGKYQCMTLEDEFRENKLRKETRIYSGCYSMGLRHNSPMDKKYSERFNFHNGMVWIRDVPEFEWIYFHVGNWEFHTSGCLLLGSGFDLNENTGRITLTKSAIAYKKVYPKLSSMAKHGHGVRILDETNI